MKQAYGIWWPDETTDRQMRHSHRYLRGIEWSIENCGKRRMAVQAGGNVGLWPRRLAKSFASVATFEPDLLSRLCLMKNAPSNVTILPQALGSERGLCAMKHRSLGSHRIVEGRDVQVIPLDALGFVDVDLIAFDLEGYELHALKGAEETIKRWSPMIQCEVRGDEEKYGYTERDVHEFLGGLGYREVSRQLGPDAVFAR